MHAKTEKDVTRVEKVLRRAFETALVEGFYPEDGTYGNDEGGCCALGMLGVIENFYDPDGNNVLQCDASNYAEILGVTSEDVGGIISGFDGCNLDELDELDEEKPRYAAFLRLGEKLREDYFLCGGMHPEEAEVDPAAAR